MKHFLGYLCFFMAAGLSAQNSIDYDKVKAWDIVVNYPEYTVKTQMMKDSKKIKPDETKMYNWYSSNKIHETKGGFDGKLLDGYYKCFSLTGNLRESGEFKSGLKSGEWISWYANGEIREILHWKNGSKNGKYKLFTETGDKMAEGNFRDDKLDGKFTYYNGKTANYKKYRNGEEVLPKEKKEPIEKTSDKTTVDKKEKTKRTPLKERIRKLFKKDKIDGPAPEPEPLREKKPEPVKEKKPEKQKKKKEKKEGQVTQARPS